jgi:hypothetical protein
MATAQAQVVFFVIRSSRVFAADLLATPGAPTCRMFFRASRIWRGVLLPTSPDLVARVLSLQGWITTNGTDSDPTTSPRKTRVSLWSQFAPIAVERSLVCPACDSVPRNAAPRVVTCRSCEPIRDPFAHGPC